MRLATLAASERRKLEAILGPAWRRPLLKSQTMGIHGTLFYGLERMKAVYPSRRELETDPSAINPHQRRLFRRMAQTRP